MSEVPRLTIFASGSGTTAEALIEATQKDKLRAEIVQVICNNSQYGLKERNGKDYTTVYDRVNGANLKYGLRIPVLTINSTILKLEPLPPEQQLRGMRDEEADCCVKAIDNSGSKLYITAGWMKIIRGSLLKRIGINNHPGILPLTADTMGIDASQKVLDSGQPKNQHTVHLISEGVDTGSIIAVHDVPVRPGDTAERLFKRTQATEKRYLPIDIDQVLEWMAEFDDVIPILNAA